MDTLCSICIEWANGRMGDEEAKRRAAQCERPTYVRDETPFGDGGYYDGIWENSAIAVDALEGSGLIPDGSVSRFFDLLDPDREKKWRERFDRMVAEDPHPGLIDWKSLLPSE